MKPITKEQYIKLLAKKFGSSNFVGPNYTWSRLCPHKCGSCGSVYDACPKSMLEDRKFSTCWPCTLEDRKIDARERYQVDLSEKWPGLTIKRYAARKSTFVCSSGHKFSAGNHDVLKSKFGCPKCAAVKNGLNSRNTHEHFLEQIKQKPRLTLKILSRYETSQKPIRVQCTNCKRKWITKPNAILNALSTGCRTCSFAIVDTAGRSEFYKYKLSGKTFNVQGYEKHAIKYLVKKRNVPATSIETASSGKLPIISYTLDKVERRYYPDIQVNQTLIEVKSVWTLTKDWKLNVAKAKATVQTGFKYRMYLVHNKKVHVLPRDWYEWSESALIAYVNRRLIKDICILALDPGVENHGWAVVSITRPFEYKILAHGLVKNTVRSIVGDIIPEFTSYLTEIQTIASTFNVNRIVAERFSSRGLKGVSIELVGQMIGALMSVHTNRIREGRRRLLMPANWKNAFNKLYDLDKLYREVSITPHELDSILMGIYAGHIWFDEKPYSMIKSSNLVKTLKKLRTPDE